MKLRRLFSILAPLAFVASLAAAQPPVLAPVGGEIQVSTTGGSSPDVAMNEAGNFVVVWAGGGVFAQRYGASGTPLGGTFQVNTFSGDQSNSRVEMDEDGGFVVVWTSGNQIPLARFSTMGRRFDSAGNPIGGEFEISTGLSALDPAIAMAADGSFAVSWQGRKAGEFTRSVYFRLYDGNGSPQTPPLHVGTTLDFAFFYDVAALPSSGWVITWTDFNLNSIRAQLYDASGAPLGPEKPAGSLATDVAVAAGGDRIVAGSGAGGDDEGPSAVLFDGSLAALAGPLQISTLPTQPTQSVAVAMDGAGRFVTAWVELNVEDDSENVLNPTRDGSQTTILARSFDATGNPLGSDFVVNTTTEGFQAEPRLAMSSTGRVVATWFGPFADSGDQIFAQIYVPVSPNAAPVARCRNLTVSAGPSCTASASIDNGSFDPDATDTVTLAQSPAGPYALGATGVTLTVTDNHGAASSCTATVTVADTTPPAISCPAAITANGNLASGGATVPFTVSATDSCDASVSVAAVPAAGSLFPFGTTTVSATAADDSGNNASCSFTVTVLSPQDQIAALIAQIKALVAAGKLAASNANPMINTLENAANQLGNGRVSQTCKKLDDFIKKTDGEINTGKLTAADGQVLINTAKAIQANIGC
jgi:hypothetical protein